MGRRTKLNFLIARRYFATRGHRSVINIISRISLCGIAVCAFALVVVLSVYNGIGQLTQKLFNVFDPELLVEAEQGKSFHLDDSTLALVNAADGVQRVIPIVEEKAWATYGGHQAIIDLRGVGDGYAAQTGLDTFIYEGTYFEACHDSSTMATVALGAGIYYGLGINRYTNAPVTLHIPRRGNAIGLSPTEAFNTAYAYATGCFFTQEDIDNRYAVCDIALVQRLLEYGEDEYTALAVSLDGKSTPQKVKQQLRQCLAAAGNPTTFTIKDRFEQQPLYYKIFRSERLAIYFILALITLISTFTLVASLALLIIDKRHDTDILRAMGLQTRDIKQVFFLQGMIITAIGCIAGLVAGFAVCLLQQRFGIITMGDNFVTHAFPVAMEVRDFVSAFLLVFAIGTLSVALTVRRMVR